MVHEFFKNIFHVFLVFCVCFYFAFIVFGLMNIILLINISSPNNDYEMDPDYIMIAYISAIFSLFHILLVCCTSTYWCCCSSEDIDNIDNINENKEIIISINQIQ